MKYFIYKLNFYFRVAYILFQIHDLHGAIVYLV